VWRRFSSFSPTKQLRLHILRPCVAVPGQFPVWVFWVPFYYKIVHCFERFVQLVSRRVLCQYYCRPMYIVYPFWTPTYQKKSLPRRAAPPGEVRFRQESSGLPGRCGVNRATGGRRLRRAAITYFGCPRGATLWSRQSGQNPIGIDCFRVLPEGTWLPISIFVAKLTVLHPMHQTTIHEFWAFHSSEFTTLYRPFR